MSRPTHGRIDFLPVRGCHPLWPAFPDGSGSDPRATGLVPFRSPLLGESRLMSFPPATEMFQFAGFASTLLGPIPLQAVGFPIRRSSDHRVLPPPRSFSQGATSFIASRCQGIHQMPLPIAREPLDPHAPTHVPEDRGQTSEDSLPCPTRPYVSQRDYSYEHTRSVTEDRRPTTEDRNTSPRPRPRRILHPSQTLNSIRQAPPWPPHLTGRPAPRRLPKPSSHCPRTRGHRTDDR